MDSADFTATKSTPIFESLGSIEATGVVALLRQNPYHDSYPRLFSGGNGADEINYENQANSSILVDSATPTLLIKTIESIEKPMFTHYRDYQLITQMISLYYGCLGFVLFSQAGRLWARNSCSGKKSSGQCIASLFLAYYGPRWFGNIFVALTIAFSGWIYIFLSSPRIRPPDNPFFIAIKKGDIDQIKELLITNRASAADIAALYGLIATDIALMYGQDEVSKFLLI